MQRPPNSQPMDYARASAELNRMAAQYGSSAQESTPRHFPDEFSTPGASRERPLRFDVYGNYGSTPSTQPSFLPPFNHSYGAYHSPGDDSASDTPAPAVIEAYRELNNKAAVVNQQRLAAQRERDRLRAELDLYLKQEGLERIVRTQVQEEEPDVKIEALQPPPRQVSDFEREEIERQKAELKRQMKQYEELRKAEEAANARHIEAKREAQHLHKLLEELQSQSAHLERSLRASTEQVRRLERQLGEDRQSRAQQEEALRQKIDRLQQAVQAEMRAREELIEKAKRDEENMANLAAAAREAINLSQAAAQQQQEQEVARRQQHYQQQHDDRRRRQKEADQATAQFEEFLERTRDSIRSLIHRADDVLAAVRNVSVAEPPRRSPKPPRHSQATQTPGRRRSRGMSAEIPAPHVSSASGSRSGSSTAESMSDHAFYEFTHERSMQSSDASEDAAMLERIEDMIPSEGWYGHYDEDEYASYEGYDARVHPSTHRRALHEPPRRVRTQSRRRSRPCERWAAPPPRKVVPMSEPPPIPFIPSASGKSFNLIGNLSEAARDLKLSYPPHLLHDPETEHFGKGYPRSFPKMRGTVDPAFQEEVEQLLLVELEDLEDRLQHLRNTSEDKTLVASLQDRIAHTREQLLAIREASEDDFRQLSPERQRNTAMLHALQERRYYREHARVPPI